MPMALIVAATLLTLAVVLYVISPILQDHHAPLEDADLTVVAETAKRVALMALRDAEYDRATGKLDEADYEVLRAELSREALAAMKHEEQLLSQAPGADKKLPSSHWTNPAPEDGGPTSVPTTYDTSDSLEAEIAELRVGLREGTTCTVCGHPNRRNSNFCTSCGRPLARGQQDGEAP
jgi:cytochrome c-type biogenesis protein CcmI